jgi:quinol monooxygenase YgiN
VISAEREYVTEQFTALICEEPRPKDQGADSGCRPDVAAAREGQAAAQTVHRQKGGMTMFEVTARLKIRDGELEGFKQQAAEMMRIAKEKDIKTLRYDWFISDDGTECEVHEAYTDADALIEHGMNVGAVRDQIFRDHAEGHHMVLYAEPSPALAALIEKLSGLGLAEFTQFEFFQGLDSPVREEVVQ